MNLNELINLTVTRLGFNKVSLPEVRPSKHGEAALDNYHHVAMTMLRKYDWPEAQRRIVLDFDPGFPENLTGFEYQYDVPGDLLKPRELNDDNTIEFRYEGGRIYCNVEEPTLRYTADISLIYVQNVISYTEELEYSSSLADAIIMELANQIGTGIKVSDSKMQDVERKAIIAYYEAIAQAGGESREEYDEPESWVEV